MNLTITESAQNKMIDILAEENKPEMRLRMFIQGGGCSGFSYGFTLDEGKNDDDFEIMAGSASVLVDAASATYIQDAIVDYEETLMGSNFKISNPNATHTCGCGSSFAV